MKDFFDLYTIFSSQEFDETSLRDAIKATFANRQTTHSENHLLFSDDFFLDSEKNKQWNNFLKKIKYKDPLSFLEVGKLIHDIMNPFWMSLSS